MKGAICSICLNSDMFCTACQAKIDGGQISKLTVEVLQFLTSLEKKHRRLADAEIIKTMGDRGGLIIIAAKGSRGKIIGPKGAIVRQLNQKFGRVRVVEEGGGKTVMENLIYPVHAIAINKVYGPDGEILRVRIRNQDRNHLPISPKEFREFTKSLGTQAELVFE